MIVVTGATGRLGAQIVDRLLERVPADTVGVSVRDIGKAADLASRGVRVRAGDFTEPGTLDEAFEDADQVLVVSAAIRGPGAAQANRAAIEAAVRAGASRVLYTSHQAASPDSLFAAQPQHAATQSLMAEQGIAWTALRHGFYASSLEIYLPAALETGELRLPEDGPFSWTSHADLAEVDAIALTQPGVLEGISPPLTAPEALDFTDVAHVLSDLTGRTITRVVVDDEEWKASAVARGLPAPVADFTLGMFRAARDGEFAATDPTLERLLGRPAISARTTIEEIVASQQ
ncbi:MAG: SDR family oxidoreductase [Nocardioides sp.]